MDSSKDLITYLHLSSIATRWCMWLTGTSTFHILPAHIGALCIIQQGRETLGPVDFIFPMPKEGQSQLVPEYIILMQERLAECYNLAWEQLRTVAEQHKRDDDTQVVQNKFQPVDLVWKMYHAHKKLTRPWVGPYVIRKVLSDCLYVMCNKKSTYTLHHDPIKPYASTHVPRLVQKSRAMC